MNRDAVGVPDGRGVYIANVLEGEHDLVGAALDPGESLFPALGDGGLDVRFGQVLVADTLGRLWAVASPNRRPGRVQIHEIFVYEALLSCGEP